MQMKMKEIDGAMYCMDERGIVQLGWMRKRWKSPAIRGYKYYAETSVSNQLRVPSKTKPRIVAGFKTSCNGLDIFLEFQAPREAVHPESLNLCHSYVWEFR